MQSLLVAFVSIGFIAVLFWWLLWTVLIPSPGLWAFYPIVFILGGIGGVVLSILGISS